ncbi:MAG: mechanosensitive ion channel family protein [Burkholderiaceae bacterium]
MQAIADRLGLDFIVEPWFIQILLIILLTVVVGVAAGFLLRLTGRIVTRAGGHWGEILVKCARRPLQVLVLAVGISQVLLLLQTQTAAPLAESVHALRKVATILCIAWFSAHFIREFSASALRARLARGETPDITTLDALSKLARLAVVIVAVLMTMQVFGLSITSLLALGGIGGIAVGFAARDVLANFLGGLTIYLDRPFSVGDWIRSPDKEIEGFVEQINWRHTRVRAFNKNPIYVPNALFTTVVVENPSRMTHRRLTERIAIRYADLPKMAAIVDDIKAMLTAHEGIDTTQTMIVAFNKYDVSGLEIYIYCFANTVVWVRFHEIKHDVLLRIGQIITGHGAEVALPTRTVHLPQEPGWSGMPPDADGVPDDACAPGAPATPHPTGEMAHAR